MGVQFIGATLTEDKRPLLAFRCECGEKSNIILVFESATLEFAFTCDGCMTVHWAIITRNPQ